MGDYAVGREAERRNKVRLALTVELAGRAQRLRMLGTAALDLAWLAEGKTDASIALSNKAWDMTAGVVIAREAGARIVDASGHDHDFDSSETIAANPRLLAHVLPIVRSVLAARNTVLAKQETSKLRPKIQTLTVALGRAATCTTRARSGLRTDNYCI